MGREREGTFSATNTSHLAVKSASKAGNPLWVFSSVQVGVGSRAANKGMCKSHSAELKGFSLPSVSGQG